ncbi:MAG: divalent-cation tolerance protein CutA [Candidatus Thorarchaeota archaeon]
MDYFIFLVTVPNLELGKNLARILVETKLAACVNIIPNILSIYTWKEDIEEDNELLLLIKTTEQKSDELIAKVKEIHTYENPECIGFKIEKATEQYLDWIRDSVD